VNHARERVEVEAKLALARGISAACLLAAVDLLSHRSKLEGHFCMHEDAPLLLRQTHISHISVPLTEASRH
jgi:hypothetical protein